MVKIAIDKLVVSYSDFHFEIRLEEVIFKKDAKIEDASNYPFFEFSTMFVAISGPSL
jgi:hypothetical protein